LGASPVLNKLKKSLVKQSKNDLYTFLPDGVSFTSKKASQMRTIYFPLCGIDGKGIKSSITPYLGGDIKIDKNCYLTKPASVEDLRQTLRNFYCYVEGKGIISFAQCSKQNSSIEVGLLWHKLHRSYTAVGLKLETLNFIPVSGEHVELMRVTVKNISKEKRIITPTFNLPIFGRTLANKHDHEHVTSLLHRIEQLPNGVCVKPTMVFDEHGHQTNETVYYVLGRDANGTNPVGTFPTVESFYGDNGNIAAPKAVVDNISPMVLSKETIIGKEATGALRFEKKELTPGESFDYFVAMGINSSSENIQNIFDQFNSPENFESAFEQNKSYWDQKTETMQFSTGDRSYNAWMRWVAMQPVLRRIYGCSFLPEHDYGKGGKGWRDIWQDLLSLILIEPENIREILINNFAGVRIDGSNATIIGSGLGEFIADRNAIARVWMDHGAWPFATLLLYINQTGDYDILLEDNTYFRDVQLSRTFEKDFSWTPKNGNFLNDKNVKIYRGSVIEHILVEHLVQFFNVGEHNITRLEDADWNDGLDMAKERGESVTFTSFYGGNFLALADLLEDLSKAKRVNDLTLAIEVITLLDSLTESPVNYDDVQAKQKFLFEVYFPSVQPEISGEKTKVPIKKVISDLRLKGKWILKQIRKNEIITEKKDGQTSSWFNGYYDNNGDRVEGFVKDRIRMTLIGQVFPIMSGLANDKEIESAVKAIGQYLKDEKLGGIRLNTDFGIPHYMDLGRAFGFAYGTKENGAFFSHMIVMYAYALYKRNFVQEGYDVLQSIYNMCIDTKKSKIYPGIPEYFDSQGRGYYHYLTGAASWLVLTQLTQVFGIKGDRGDLIFEPKLVCEEFDSKTRSVTANCNFAGKKISVTYENPQKLDAGKYAIGKVFLNGKPAVFTKEGENAVKIKREVFEDSSSEYVFKVILTSV